MPSPENIFLAELFSGIDDMTQGFAMTAMLGMSSKKSVAAECGQAMRSKLVPKCVALDQLHGSFLVRTSSADLGQCIRVESSQCLGKACMKQQSRHNSMY